MKKNTSLLLLFFVIISCKAQSPIVGLDSPSNTPTGTYYKDLNNELDKFTGTWKFVNGNTSFILTLEKKEDVFISPNYYDELIGEYKYTENGSTIINTLPNLSSGNDNNIGGSYIIKPSQKPKCTNCSSNDRRIRLYFNDPDRSYLSVSIVLRYLIDQTNPNKITVVIYANDGVIIPAADSPTMTRVPYGEYTMEKQ